jgi:RNA 2',3'-cyclic 3'-phosphodiesterase
MRLFLALDIDDAIRRRIARFVEGVREFAPDARWVVAESYHVTLKFLGERGEEQLPGYRHALATVKHAPFAVEFRGIGFFPTARSARVFWTGIHAGPGLPALATAVGHAFLPLGEEGEARAFSPHLTLARSGSGRPQRQPGDHPNRAFQRLQEKLSAIPAPAFGTMTAREFFLYQSKLSPQGARYSKLERFPLE